MTSTAHPIAEPFVGPFVYVRFHGTSGMYHGSYSGRQLSTWAHRLAELACAGLPVYAYFNNDPGAVAVENALTVRSDSPQARPMRLRASTSRSMLWRSGCRGTGYDNRRVSK